MNFLIFGKGWGRTKAEVFYRVFGESEIDILIAPANLDRFRNWMLTSAVGDVIQLNGTSVVMRVGNVTD